MGSPPGVYGSRRRHMANPIANMLPIVYCTTCINVLVITRSIMEARTQGRRDMRSRGRSRDRDWALGGRIWNLSYGVSPSISLGPADGDLLTEPTFSRGGVLRPRNTLRIWLSLVKNRNHKISIKFRGGGRGRGWWLWLISTTLLIVWR